MNKVNENRSLLLFIILNFLTCGLYGLFFIHSWAKDINTICENDGEHTSGLLMYIILTFLTCGIYPIYWHYKNANRLYNISDDYNITINEDGTTILLWYLLGALLCGIGPFIALFILINNTNRLASAYNAKNKNTIY